MDSRSADRRQVCNTSEPVASRIFPRLTATLCHVEAVAGSSLFSSPTFLALWLPWRRRLRGQPELGHHRHLIEIDVDLRELAALESRNEGNRKSDGLVRCRNCRAPRQLQRCRVGSLEVA